MKVDLNSASFEELTQLPMITEHRAHDIIAYRNQHGPFRQWDEVKNVPGISKEMAQEIRRQGGVLGGSEEDAA
jgi:competence protein ComEA